MPIVCRETVAELLRVLAYPKFRLSDAEQSGLLEDFLPFAETVVLAAGRPPLPLVCRDPDDLVFIELALASGADALVSGDGDLAVLRGVAPVAILSVAALISEIG